MKGNPVDPSYRHYVQDNPFQVILRHGTQFFADTLTHCVDVVVDVENAIVRVFDENAVHMVKI